MKALIPLSYSLVIFLFVSSCSPEKEPINYGQDNCHSCNMTIVDNQYGSEVVSNKGKVYKFDAVECMLNFLDEGELNQGEVALKLVNGYNKPGPLVDATQAYYLRSEALPSPMGYFITPFTNKNKAESVKQKKGGKVYNWESLNKAFDNFSRNMQEQ